mgnify:CR=1 FL=1
MNNSITISILKRNEFYLVLIFYQIVLYEFYLILKLIKIVWNYNINYYYKKIISEIDISI